MNSRLHILVTCTKLKTLPIPADLKLRSVRGATLRERCEKWIARVQQAHAQRRPAIDLYSGDHWGIAKSLSDIATNRGFEPQLWVISTGFGLIPGQCQIPAYSATFSSTHPDSVCVSVNGSSRASSFAEWWRLLGQWAGPSHDSPRSLSALFAAEPKATFMVIASAAYLDAIRSDLEAAAGHLTSLQQLLVVSAGTKNLGSLTACLIPVDARLQAELGGARRTLNVRVARRVLQGARQNTLRADNVAARCSRWLRNASAIPVISRVKGSDAEISRFIADELRRNPKAAFSPLLRKYRDSGRACEHSRFHRLFDRVRSTRHG